LSRRCSPSWRCQAQQPLRWLLIKVRSIVKELLLFFLAPRFSFVLCLVTCLAALLAASLDKLNAREKELLDSKGFVESKRSERVKEVAQLEESLKGERKCC
jgi:hypothetical protein